MARPYAVYAVRRVQRLVALFDALAEKGPATAYSCAPKILCSRRNAWRYAAALVKAGCAKMVPVRKGQYRTTAYVVTVDRESALRRIQKFCERGVHRRKRPPSQRMRMVVRTTVDRLRAPDSSGISTRYAGLGLFDDE